MQKTKPTPKDTKVDPKIQARSRSKSPKNEKIKDQKVEKADKGDKKDKKIAPKKASSAYLFFLQDNREKLTAQGFKGKDVMVEAGKLWGAMNEKDKAKYEEMNVKDKERHDREVKDFELKGYYINSEGVKICKPNEGKENAKDKKKDKSDKSDKSEKSAKGGKKEKKNDKKKKAESEESDEDDD